MICTLIKKYNSLVFTRLLVVVSIFTTFNVTSPYLAAADNYFVPNPSVVPTCGGGVYINIINNLESSDNYNNEKIAEHFFVDHLTSGDSANGVIGFGSGRSADANQNDRVYTDFSNDHATLSQWIDSYNQSPRPPVYWQTGLYAGYENYYETFTYTSSQKAQILAEPKIVIYITDTSANHYPKDDPTTYPNPPYIKFNDDTSGSYDASYLWYSNNIKYSNIHLIAVGVNTDTPSGPKLADLKAITNGDNSKVNAKNLTTDVLTTSIGDLSTKLSILEESICNPSIGLGTFGDTSGALNNGNGTGGNGNGTGNSGTGTGQTGNGTGTAVGPAPASNPTPMPVKGPQPNPAPIAVASTQPNPAPTPTAQGTQVKPPDPVPSPFLDGILYPSGSAPDKLVAAMTRPPSPGKFMSIGAGLAIVLTGGGLLLAWRKRRERS